MRESQHNSHKSENYFKVKRRQRMEDLSIGMRIKQRRKELGLTQVQIKQATGISSGNMSDIENGNKLPSALALISLSIILNCSIDWMLKGELPQNDKSVLPNEREFLFLEGFKTLCVEDQDELLEILQMKLRKNKKDAAVKSSSSTNTGKDNIAG